LHAYTIFCLFIPQLMDTWVASIMNKATMNVCVHIFV
jgi:hypothetical protein